MKKILTLIVVFMTTLSAFAQTVGDYRSAAAGPSAWATAASWERYDGAMWVAAVAAPTSADGVITIQSGHTINIAATLSADQVIVEATAVLTVESSITFTIANGADAFDCDVTGTIQNNAGTITTTGALRFNANGTYKHNYTTTAGTIPTATWNAASNLEIIGYTTFSSAVPGFTTTQTFGNVTWNCAAQTSALNMNLNGTYNIAGNFTITSTGSGSVRFAGSAHTINIGGGFSMASGTLDLSGSSANSTIKVAGTVNQAGGTITESGSSTGTVISFNGTSLQNVTLSGTILNTISFGIENNAGINLTGTMPITPAAKLIVSSTAANPIDAASSGSVSYAGTAASPAVLVYADLAVSLGFSGGNQSVNDKVFPASGIAAGTFQFQVYNSTASPNNVVSMNTTGSRSITKPTSVFGVILTQGVVDLKNTDLNCASYDVYDPLGSYSSGKMFVTNGTGAIKLTTAVLVTTITFPLGDNVGTVEYSPMSFVYSAKSASSTIGVKVTDGAHPSVGAVADYYKRYWSVTDDIGAGTYTLSTFQLKEPTTSDFGTAANMRMSRWNGSAWTQVASAVTASSGTTTGDVNGVSTPNETVATFNGMDYTCRTANPAATYTWIGGATGAYATASNWTPSRGAVDPSDILQFDGVPATVTVTGFTSQTIGKLLLSGSVDVAFQSSATATLSMGGGGALITGDVLAIPAGSKLRSNGTTNAMSLAFAGTSRTATVAGDIFLEGSASHNLNTLNCVMTVNSPGTINVGGTTGTSITNGTSTNLVMNTGTTFNVTRSAANVPNASFATGSNIVVGSSGTPVTSTFTLNMPSSAGNYNPNVTIHYSNTSVQTISLNGAMTFVGTWNLFTYNTARIRLSGSSTNTWTFTKPVTMTCTNAASGIEVSSQTASSPSTWYTFGDNTTAAPSLSITGGALAQQATTSTNAAFTTVAISNGLTIGNNGSIVANNNSGAVTTGDFLININKGDMSFGTGTTMTGTVSSSGTTTSKLIIAFPAAATADQSFTPAVTTTGRTQISVAKTTSGNVNMSTRDLTTNTILCTGGKLVANALNINIVPVGTGTNSGVASGSKTANSWIVLTTGKLQVQLIGTGGKRFPVGVGTGTNDYVGLQIYNATGTNNVAANTNNITVGVTSGITPATLINAPQQIQVTWDIARSNTGINFDAEIYYDDAKAGGSCTPSASMTLSRYNGTNWGLALGTTVTGTPISGAAHGTDRVFSVAGISATSPFAVGNSVVLAAEFTNITAQAKGSMNVVNFTTATEKDVKEFAVERSVNNRAWEVIGTVAAIGGTSTTNYSFNDVNPSTLSYYRVRSVETNGKDQISKIVAVKRNGGKLAVNMVSPVPTTEGVNVDFSTSKIGTLNVVITDIVGKVVRTERFTTVEGANLMRLNLSNLAQGSYILSLNDGETIATQRIVKQ
jgi:hypothetical protein